jgi:hypothetical protein
MPMTCTFDSDEPVKAVRLPGRSEEDGGTGPVWRGERASEDPLNTFRIHQEQAKIRYIWLRNS